MTFTSVPLTHRCLMLELNKPVHAEDPVPLLKYERGVFELTSPGGERLRVAAPLTRFPLLPEEESVSGDPLRRWWRVQKIAQEEHI